MRLPYTLILLISQVSFAFIPPVPWLVREAFEGRKPRKATEIVFKHVLNGSEVEERVLVVGSRYYFLWRSPTGLLGGSLDKQNYNLGSSTAIPGRTSVPLKYYGSTNSEDFLTQLVNEGFVQRDQLPMYKTGFTGEGDPAQWNLKENYQKNPGIFLFPLANGVAIKIVGNDSVDNGKSVYLDNSSKALRRLEWKDGGTVAWNFDESRSRWGARGRFRAT